MKKRFTKEQIAYALKRHETGISTKDICREMGVSEASFYKWKLKYAGMGVTELRKLKAIASLTGLHVVESLEEIRRKRPLPQAIMVDNGSEFISKKLYAWAYYYGVKLNFIRLGKPIENAFVESFNGRLRDECLNLNIFNSLSE
jgi:transposase InsO family protein